jgi:hypothetical protein
MQSQTRSKCTPENSQGHNFSVLELAPETTDSMRDQHVTVSQLFGADS